MATTCTLRPTRLTSSESDVDELKAHSLIQNVEQCILHVQPKDPKMQRSLYVVYIQTSILENNTQPHPQPDSTDPNHNSPPVDPAIENVLKKLSS